MESIIAILVLASVQVAYTQNNENQSAYFPPFIIPESEIPSCLVQQQRETALHQVRSMITSKLLIATLISQCGVGLWTRIAYLNMSDPMQSCPQNWSDSRSTNGVRVCGRPTNTTNNCQSVFYSSDAHSYTKVCGRVTGYQFGHPDGIRYHGKHHYYSYSIDESYVDGVSITHGSPRSHIWTFAGDRSENNDDCPCKGGLSAPPFVEDNYYCESAYTGPGWDVPVILYTSDPLWDGAGCESEGSCCSTAPWFTVDLGNSTSDDIEVRICSSNINLEDTPIQLLELYIA